MDCRYETQQTLFYAAEMEACEQMHALAMLYSPWQQWTEVYDAKQGLMRGTIFQQLDQPFLEGACPYV